MQRKPQTQLLKGGNIMLKNIIMAIIDVMMSTIAFLLLVGILFLSTAALIAWEDSYIKLFMWAVNAGSIIAIMQMANKEIDNLEEDDEDEDEELT